MCYISRIGFFLNLEEWEKEEELQMGIKDQCKVQSPSISQSIK